MPPLVSVTISVLLFMQMIIGVRIWYLYGDPIIVYLTAGGNGGVLLGLLFVHYILDKEE